MKTCHQRIMVKYFFTEKDINIHFFFRSLQLHLLLPNLLTKVNKYILHCQIYVAFFAKSYAHHLVFHTGKFRILE